MKAEGAKKKPVAKLIGADGNTMNLLAICTKALKRSGQDKEANELRGRVFKSGSYNEALQIMSEYCKIV